MALAIAAIGAAGFAASLTGLYVGMRDVMEVGGFCARGGPYVIGTECTDGQVILMVVSVLGLLVFWGVHAAGTSLGGRSAFATSLLMWGAIFGALGWNFLYMGLDPPQQVGSAWGWIVSGVVFWAMALAGLIPAAAIAIRWLRGVPEQPAFTKGPLVRAAVPTAAAPTAPDNRHEASPTPVPKRLVMPTNEPRSGEQEPEQHEDEQ